MSRSSRAYQNLQDDPHPVSSAGNLNGSAAPVTSHAAAHLHDDAGEHYQHSETMVAFLEKFDDVFAFLKKRGLVMISVTLAMATLAGLILIIMGHYSSSGKSGSTTPSLTCPLFCGGAILDAVNSVSPPLLNDSKSFVDMPAKFDPDVVINNFNSLGNVHNYDLLKAFLDQNFDQPGTDLMNAQLQDFNPHPPFIHSSIQDAKYQTFAEKVVAIWPDLARRVADDVFVNPSRHSLMPMKYPFVMPGGRFREYYYWDTYWVVRGLLTCGMVQTALGMVENLLDMVRVYGFVPNGGRTYYVTRSQPPMLVPMIDALFNATQDKLWLASVMDALDTEYNWWMTPGKHALNFSCTAQGCVVTKPAKGSTYYTLNRYYTEQIHPRPESYLADVQTAANYAGNVSDLYRHITSGAESGWDFSTRWFYDDVTLTSIRVMAMIPADLNAILLHNERTLSKFYTILNNNRKASVYLSAAQRRYTAIEQMLWHSSDSQWHDYYFADVTFPNGTVGLGPTGIVSNFVCMWAQCYQKPATQLARDLAPFGLSLPGNVDTDITSTAAAPLKPDYGSFNAMFLAVQRSGLDQPGGFLTTMSTVSTQQWDYPNAWAPLQHFVIEGFVQTQDKNLTNLAVQTAGRWVYSNYLAYQTRGVMYEKYNALDPGQGGGAGEYTPQEGFGWTNGVVLVLLEKYGLIISSRQTEAELRSRG